MAVIDEGQRDVVIDGSMEYGDDDGIAQRWINDKNVDRIERMEDIENNTYAYKAAKTP